jgi:hypothetical protein
MGYKAGAALLRGISEIEPDGLKNFARIYGEQVKDALHAGAISESELHEALKKHIERQARDEFASITRLFAYQTHAEDVLSPEFLVYGLQNGLFSPEEKNIIEKNLRYFDTLEQFNAHFGKRNLFSVMTRKLLSPPREIEFDVSNYY